MPGPPPTALVANLPYNVSVPVLLHLLTLLPSLERGLVMVQAEVADRLAAAPGLEGLRRPVGQGRLVRRRTPRRRDRPQRLLAGAQRRLRPGRLDPPRAARPPPPPASRCSRSSTRPSPSAARRCAARCAGWPAPPRPPTAALEHAGVDPLARGEALDVDRLRPDRRGAAPDDRASAPVATAARLTVRAPAKINLHLGVGAAREDGFHPLRTVYQAVGLYDDVTVDRRRRLGGSTLDVRRLHRRRRRARSTTTTSSTAPPTCSPRTTASTAAGRRRSIAKAIPVAGGHGRRLRRRRRRAGRARPAVGRSSTSDDDLLALAAELGSDVPFALRRRHRARHRPRRAGRRPVADRGTWWWVVVPVRATGLSTPAVYRHFDELFPDAPADRRRPPTRCSPRWPTGDPHALGRARCTTTSRPPRSTCAPTSATCSTRGEAEGALRGLVSGSGPDLRRSSAESRRPRPRRSRPPCADDGHPVVLVANGPVAGAHVVESMPAWPTCSTSSGSPSRTASGRCSRRLPRRRRGRADRHRRAATATARPPCSR